ncbi:hypothetical protein D3C77_465640 [compost metagenome]
MLHAAEVYPHRHVKKIINFTHLLTVALSQIIVHRNDVHAFAEERIQINRQGTYQCFPFTGFHLCDTAFMERHASD